MLCSLLNYILLRCLLAKLFRQVSLLPGESLVDESPEKNCCKLGLDIQCNAYVVKHRESEKRNIGIQDGKEREHCGAIARDKKDHAGTRVLFSRGIACFP